MPAYIIVEIEILDSVGYEEYKKLDQSTVEVKRMLAGLIKKVEADRRGTDY